MITIFIFVGITEAGGGSEAGDTASGDDAIFAPRAEDGTVIFVYAATSKRAVDGAIDVEAGTPDLHGGFFRDGDAAGFAEVPAPTASGTV